MRIVLLLAVLFVAAWLPVALAAGLSANSSQQLRRKGPHMAHHLHAEFQEFGEPTPWEGAKKMQSLLLEKGPLECCPSREEFTTPAAGRDIYGNIVHLQSVSHGLASPQTFYEVSCLEEALNRPCRFLDHRMHNQSRCVQKHSYTYAMVYNHSSARGQPQLRLDYIQINSGCVCTVFPKRHGRHQKSRNRKNKPD